MKSIGWRKARERYEDSDISIRDLARLLQVDEKTVRKRIKAENWQRESARKPQLPARITDDDWGRGPERIVPPRRVESEVKPADLVKTARVIVDMLMTELRVASANADLLEQIVEEETAGDKSPRRRDFMLRMVSMPVRAKTMQNLASALRMLDDAAPGKKEQAQEDAKTAGAGSDWGDDLGVSVN